MFALLFCYTIDINNNPIKFLAPRSHCDLASYCAIIFFLKPQFFSYLEVNLRCVLYNEFIGLMLVNICGIFHQRK